MFQDSQSDYIYNVNPQTNITVSFDLSEYSDLSGFIIQSYDSGEIGGFYAFKRFGETQIDYQTKIVEATQYVGTDNISVWLERDTERGTVRLCGNNEIKLNVVSGESLSTSFDLCGQIPGTAQKDKCLACEAQTPSGVWTAVGCIKTDATTVVGTIVRIGLGLAGGVALLMIVAAGFLFSTSQGDQKRTGEARDMMTSAVIGLLFIIFSITILQFIGVQVLRVPGFGT